MNEGQEHVCQLLLMYKANPLVTMKDGTNCIHLAAALDLRGILKLFLEKLGSAIVDLPNLENGMTALMYAAKMGHLQIVKLLLTFGADPQNLKAKSGESALSFASAFPSVQEYMSKWLAASSSSSASPVAAEDEHAAHASSSSSTAGRDGAEMGRAKDDGDGDDGKEEDRDDGAFEGIDELMRVQLEADSLVHLEKLGAFLQRQLRAVEARKEAINQARIKQLDLIDFDDQN